MTSNAPTQLPAYISLRYQENGVFDKYESRADEAVAHTKRLFEQSFKETERVISGSLGKITSQFGKLDLGLGDMRQQSADIRLYRDALEEASRVANDLAKETGDTSQQTRQYLQALSAQRAEADRALQVADAQVLTYTRLQEALDGAASANGRLAQSQREQYAEAARAAQAEVAARQVQSTYASNFRYDARATDSGAGFSVLADRAAMDELRRAELGAAESSRLLEATHRNTALALDHTTKSARDSAAAFMEAERAQQAMADEANVLRQALDPSLAVQQRFDAELARADKLLEAGAISTKEYASAQELARNNLTQGYAALFEADEATKKLSQSHEQAANSAGRQRAAIVNLSQNLQDVVVQAQAGTAATTIFAQQGGQIASALSDLIAANAASKMSMGDTGKAADEAGSDIQGLGDEIIGASEKVTHTRGIMGGFASFMAGPWGGLVVVAAATLLPLIANLFAADEAADDAGKSQKDFIDILRDSTASYEELTKAARDYADQGERSRQVTILQIQAEAEATEQRLRNAVAIRKELQANLELYQQQVRAGPTGPNGQGQLGAAIAETYLNSQVVTNKGLIEQLMRDADEIKFKAADAIADINSDPQQKIKTGFEVLRREARKTIKDIDALSARLTQLNNQETAALKALQDASKSTHGPSASAEASLGDMTALIKQLFPGARITSTTGGTHVKGSDHYAGRAIDFVPGGGMGKYTTSEVEQILRDAGVDIRRNAKGTEQLFGPGRPAAKPGDHDDHFHVAWQGSAPDPDRIAAATKRAEELLKQFGDRSAESIEQINERFDEQPRLIDQAEQATRRLDKIIADLSERKPPGFEQMIADAEQAKQTVQQALVRPFAELTRDSERRLQVQQLLSQGRDDEAVAVQEIWRYEEQNGKLVGEQRDAVRDLVIHEQQRSRELERQRALFEAQLDVLDQTKRSLTDILSGRSTDFFGDIQQSLKDLQGKRLFDQLFGNTFRDLEDELRGQTPLERETGRMAGGLKLATDALGDFTGALGGAGASNDNPGGGVTVGSADFNRAFASIISGTTVGWSGQPNAPGAMSATGEVVGPDMVVTAKRPTEISGKSTSEIADKIAGAIIAPFDKALKDAFGTEFSQMLSGTMKGALSGYITGGATGGILGGLKGMVDSSWIFGNDSYKVSGALGKAGAGAATGTMSAGIMKSLGLKTSTTGAQIGGAVGSFIPIPGGQIIGSVVGGLIGGLFKGNTTANAVLTNGTSYTQRGADSGNYSTAAGLGDSVLSGLNNVVDKLGGEIGNFMVTIGTRGDEYRVNTTGTSLKLDKGAISFGDDAEAAIAYAIKDAIEDGAIKGMRASTLNIIKAGDDLEAALDDALSWENVFKELKQYKDPIGAALDDLDEQFGKLVDIANTAGASTQEMADLEELYGIKRNEIIKQQAEELIGSLQSLYTDLTTGDNGLSLRTRRAAALDTYDDLAARVKAGDSTAYDDYAEAAKSLLDIERSLYGSQQEYFDRLNEVTDLTKSRIDAETNVVSIAQNRDSPFDATGAVKSSIDSQTDALTTRLDAVNTNIGTLINLWGQMTSGSSASTGTSRISFASNF
jgi:hypothetical protein